MKKKIDNLIKVLKESHGVKNVELYVGTKRGFKYYYTLSGFIGKKYFDFGIMKHKKVGKLEVEIYKETECKVLIEQIVKECINDEKEIKWV